MGRISYNELNFDSNRGQGNSNRELPGYFSLTNDGDEAIVRFMYDSVEDFEILAVHPITVDGKFRKISCLREGFNDDVNKCPLCASGEKIQQKFYIHLIQYVRDNDGKVVPQAKVWERSTEYAKRLKNLMNEYGPLSDCIFKIRRNGVKGSMDTTYDIMFGSPNVYTNELYPKKSEMFENYSVLGTQVMDKNFDDINYFIQTGTFPKNTPVENQAPVNAYNEPAYTEPTYTTPVQPVSERAPWDEPQTSVTPDRPTRYY